MKAVRLLAAPGTATSILSNQRVLPTLSDRDLTGGDAAISLRVFYTICEVSRLAYVSMT